MTAPGTSPKEIWEIKEIKEDGKGEVEVVAKGTKTPYLRSFRPEQFVEFLQSDKIITEEVEIVTILDGKEMWVEKVVHMPFQKRRGRKPAGYYTAHMEAA